MPETNQHEGEIVNSRRQPITSADVARHAGVSQSAVSLVISGKAGTRVSATTAERIRQSAVELGYSPNHAAVMLRTGVAPTLALAVPTVTQPFFSSVLVAAERRARESGYSMILLDSGSDELWVSRLSAMLRGGVLAGAIAYAPTVPEAEILQSTGFSVVLADVEFSGSPSIRFDFSDGAREAAEHLSDLGHTRIAYLAASSERETYRLRLQAFTAEVESRGGAVVAIEHSASLEFDDAVKAGERLIALGAGLTAVMCDDDLLAAAMLRAAGAGRIPGSLSVIGVGDIELSRMLTPELTTVELSAERIGAGAVDLILQLDQTDHIATRLIPSRLIVRGSTGPAPR